MRAEESKKGCVAEATISEGGSYQQRSSAKVGTEREGLSSPALIFLLVPPTN